MSSEIEMVTQRGQPPWRTRSPSRRSGRFVTPERSLVEVRRSGRSARPQADGVHGGRRVIHARRRLGREVIRAGLDERTRLRLSRISITRCADLIRCSASASSPLAAISPPRHGSTRHGPTSACTGPSARQRRQYGGRRASFTSCSVAGAIRHPDLRSQRLRLPAR
jgi:hypothetical protein